MGAGVGVNGWGEWFGGESFVKISLLYFIKEFPSKLIMDLQQKNLQKNSM